jgi:hypothetical protein
MDQTPLLRPAWKKVFQNAWVLAVVLFVVLGIVRVYGLSGPLPARQLVLVSFAVMWFLPFIFLTPEGRERIGVRRAANPLWYPGAAVLGALGGMAVFAFGCILFGKSGDHWYVSILASWGMDGSLASLPKYLPFLLYTVPAILFSPVGEELFFRGMIHESVNESWGETAAAWISGLAFAGIHLFHHGLSFDASGIHLRLLSGLLWFGCMTALSRLFSECRRRSGSIGPSIVAHASFNLAMNATIFLFLV